MVTFQAVYDSFKERGCELLVDEEEFNKNKHSTTEKYKYIASCGHKHEVWLNVFKNRGTGVICPNCTVNIDAKNIKTLEKLEPSRNTNLEYNNLIYFKEINEQMFDIRLTTAMSIYKSNKACTEVFGSSPSVGSHLCSFWFSHMCSFRFFFNHPCLV